jgi:hypothetical protein
MSDDWILYVQGLSFGAVLALIVQSYEVNTVVLENADLPGHSQDWVQNNNALRTLQSAADLAREQARSAPEKSVLVNAPPGGADEAQRLQGNEKRPTERDTVEDKIEELAKIVEGATETEEERRRQSSEATQELLEARTAELAALLDKQKEERVSQTVQLDEQRSQLEKKYADSPKQEQHLKAFEEVAATADKEMKDRHNAQLKQFEDRWQQKFEQFQEQPLIMPIDRDRDDR